MSRRWRGVLIVGVLLGALEPSAASAEDKNDSGNIVCLATREPDSTDQWPHPPAFLPRELLRQAFLIAARDECGLGTRDKTLREEFPSQGARFEMWCAYGLVDTPTELRAALSRLPDRKRVPAPPPLWDWKSRIDADAPEMIVAVAEKAEAFSRGAFRDLIKRAGLAKPVVAARKTAQVPRDAEEGIWSWNEIAVLGALRTIHAEIHARGESPELLAALVLGYANLGALTEYYFSPSHKAFAARALLYSQRLMHETGESAWARWHRAYARALVGLHNLAAADVQAAKTHPGKPGVLSPLPVWSEVIDQFCQGALPRMLASAKGTAQNQTPTRLAKYLNLEAAMSLRMNDLRIKAARAVLDDVPDCLRAVDAMCATSQLVVMRQTTSRAFDDFSKTVRKRLLEVHNLPKAIAGRIRGNKPQKDPSDEIEFRTQLVSALAAAAEGDRGEPSLSALGRLVEEIEFKQLLRRLELEATVWAVPTDETLAVFRPLCGRHPYAAFLDAFSSTKKTQIESALTLLATVDPTEIGYVESAALQWLRQMDEKRAVRWLIIRYCHADRVFRDEMMGIDEGAAGTGTADQKQLNDAYLEMVWQTSSKMPASVAVRIRRDWEHARADAAAYERDYKDDPVIMSALADKYLELKKLDDAERCAKQKIRIAPDYPTYETLAAVYKARNDMRRWKETLEESTNLPSPGLEAFQVRNKIALYHMHRNEWKEAVVYADAAAVSYAQWALLTASRCHEKLGEWTKSEELVRAASERYEGDGAFFDWMLWCHRTGHGDANAAAELALKHFTSLASSAGPSELEQIGVYYLLKKEPAKALAVFRRAFRDGNNPFNALHAALIADSLGQAADRDQLLAQAVVASQGKGPAAEPYLEAIRDMKRVIISGTTKEIDFKRLDAVIEANAKFESPANVAYFVGSFLKNHAEPEKSREYLIKSAQSADYRRYNHVLACQALRDARITVPPSNIPEIIDD